MFGFYQYDWSVQKQSSYDHVEFIKTCRVLPLGTMSRVDAVILNLQRGVGVATLVGEFMDLTKTSDRSPLCVIGGNSSLKVQSDA